MPLLPLIIISSPEHEVLMVRRYDRSLSVVYHPLNDNSSYIPGSISITGMLPG